MNNEHCPCCPNNCHKDDLKCGRGHNYFNSSNDSSGRIMPIHDGEENAVITDLRKCGHLLHHNRNLDTDSILANFSEDELDTLHTLLSKFYNSAN